MMKLPRYESSCVVQMTFVRRFLVLFDGMYVCAKMSLLTLTLFHLIFFVHDPSSFTSTYTPLPNLLLVPYRSVQAQLGARVFAEFK